MTAALEFDGVSVSFSSGLIGRRYIHALRDFSLEIEEGSIFGLLGPNGAGKSTAVYVALGLLRPNAGSCRILGEHPTPGAPVFGSIGYLPEEPHYHDFLTVREALAFYARLFSPAHALPLDETLARVGMLDSADRMLRQCSKGMKQRLGLAQAIIHKPRVLILDEPTRGLDPMIVRDFRTIMQELNREGTTILVNSHVLSEVEMTCTRVAILKSGRIAVTGKIEDLLTLKDTFEIRYEAVSGLDLPGAAHVDGVWHVEVTEPDLDAAWAHLRQNDARLLTLTRMKKSLEEIFVEAMGKHP